MDDWEFRHWPPEVRLWVAVLFQAVADLDSPNSRERNDAKTWFLTYRHHYLLDLLYLNCEKFDKCIVNKLLKEEENETVWNWCYQE